MEMRLITFGLGNKLNCNLINKIKNRKYSNKPTGGLWASPIDAKYSWKDWGTINDWGDFSTKFEFKIQGNILKIDSYNDLIEKMPIMSNEMLMTEIDFEILIKNKVDAIWLTTKGEAETRFSEPSLCGWDCECVLILNKNCIIKE